MRFPFGNTEPSLELWNIIPGISGFDDWDGAMKRLGLIIPMAFLVLIMSAVGCGTNVASAPDVDATEAAAVAATRTASDVEEKVKAAATAPNIRFSPELLKRAAGST